MITLFQPLSSSQINTSVVSLWLVSTKLLLVTPGQLLSEEQRWKTNTPTAGLHCQSNSALPSLTLQPPVHTHTPLLTFPRTRTLGCLHSQYIALHHPTSWGIHHPQNGLARWWDEPRKNALFNFSPPSSNLNEKVQRQNNSKHIACCCCSPIMMYKPVAVGEYNSDMSDLWFGHNLHGYNSLSTGSRLREAMVAGCNDCTLQVYFKLLGLTHPSPSVNTQSW